MYQIAFGKIKKNPALMTAFTTITLPLMRSSNNENNNYNSLNITAASSATPTPAASSFEQQQERKRVLLRSSVCEAQQQNFSSSRQIPDSLTQRFIPVSSSLPAGSETAASMGRGGGSSATHAQQQSQQSSQLSEGRSFRSNLAKASQGSNIGLRSEGMKKISIIQPLNQYNEKIIKAPFYGLSYEFIESFISELKSEAFTFSLNNRIIIKNINVVENTLTVGDLRDNLILDVMRSVLEAIFKPVFVTKNTNFIPNSEFNYQLTLKYISENKFKDCT